MVKRRLFSIVAILGGLIAFVLLLFMATQVGPAASRTNSSSIEPVVSEGNGSEGVLKELDVEVQHDQTDSSKPNGYLSQESETIYDISDSLGADNITVPDAKHLIISSVDILGSTSITSTILIPEVDIYLPSLMSAPE
jgi:hypothetical protein